MHQILFKIPTPWGSIPIFGFGIMLFVAFALGTWFAARRAKAEGIHPDHLWDLATYLFIGGVLGARILHMVVFPEPGDWKQQILHFFEIWKGGMVFYGGVVGGLLAFAAAYYRIIKPNKLRTLQLMDVVSPSVAVGIFFGRIGCLLNGCCFGDVATNAEAPYALTFPSNSNPHRDSVGRGYQLAYGFLLNDNPVKDLQTVDAVVQGSSAHAAGLQSGDRITSVGEEQINTPESLHRALAIWPQGQPLELGIERDGVASTISYDPPRSVPLHATQLYSSFDGLLLLLLMLAYYPLRKRYGELTAILFLAYPLNRFLIEKLRSDTEAAYFGYFTLSQAISIGSFALALLFLWFVRRQPLISNSRLP